MDRIRSRFSRSEFSGVAGGSRTAGGRRPPLQGARVTKGKIATGGTTRSLSPVGDGQKEENYQTNPILAKPAWKIVPTKAKNEPKSKPTVFWAN
jgi:hypothetical protein